MKRGGDLERRTPLQSFTGLQRSGPMPYGQPMRRGGRIPQRRAQPRRRDRGEEQDWERVVRPLAVARSLGCCEWCGLPHGPVVHLHHLQLKTRGGPDHITNAAALHPLCHLAVGPDGVHREEKHHRDRGFMLSSADIPGTVPLVLASGRRVLLSDHGTYLDMPETPDGPVYP